MWDDKEASFVRDVTATILLDLRDVADVMHYGVGSDMICACPS